MAWKYIDMFSSFVTSLCYLSLWQFYLSHVLYLIYVHKLCWVHGITIVLDLVLFSRVGSAYNVHLNQMIMCSGCISYPVRHPVQSAGTLAGGPLIEQPGDCYPVTGTAYGNHSAIQNTNPITAHNITITRAVENGHMLALHSVWLHVYIAEVTIHIKPKLNALIDGPV